MQIHPAQCNSTGKQEKENRKHPLPDNIDIMLPDDIDEQSKERKRRKRMAAGKAKAIHVSYQGV